MASWNGKVLVVGATGALGRPVVQGLLERGVAVRALCRHPEQADDLAALGAEVVAGDLTDAASLARATAGVQRVLAAAHGILGRGRWRSEAVDDAGHRSLFAAARNAGVDRLVYGTNFGGAYGNGDLTAGMGLNEVDREKIRSGNAIELLNLVPTIA